MFFFEPVLFIANIVPDELRGGRAHLARRYDMPDGVFSISEGKNGRIYMSSVRKVFVFGGDGSVRTMHPSGAPAFSMLLSDALSKRVFMFTVSDGLYELHEDASVTKIETGDIKGISYVMTDSEGMMWLGTYNEGVLCLDEGTGEIIQFGKNEGLTDLSIKSIVEDSDGNIWFSNRTNLVRYDKSQGTLASVHDDWFIDGRSYSLVASASNDEGVVFFGGNAGITRVDTGIPLPEPQEKSLRLEQVIIGGKPADLVEGRVVLDHDDGMLSLRMAAIDYDSGPYLTYSYKLEGRDRNWTYVRGEGIAVYSHIPAGKYVFKAKVRGNDGEWGTEELEIPIVVKHNPLSVWIIVLVVFGVVMLPGIFFLAFKRRAGNDTGNEVQEESSEEDSWYDTSDFNEADKAFVSKLTSLLEESLDNEKFTVNDIAMAMGMSYSSLYAKVKSLTGGTPQYFVTAHRMKKAEALLKSGSFSVSEVAYKVGSSSPMTFSREFKKFFGYPPSQLLKDHQ